MTNEEQREAVVAEAKTWLGTPFHHMGRLKGVGVDCGQLLALVYPAALGMDVKDPGFYRFQHHMNSSREDYIAHLEKYTKEITEEQAGKGDIVMYKCGRTFSHGGIIVDTWPGLIIHSIVDFGVIYAHGTTDGALKSRERRYFSVWG